MTINPTFIQRYNQAAALARAGQHQQALEAYQEILAPTPDATAPRDVTGEFLAHIELGKLYCLMDLGRYDEAKTLCENEQMQEALLEQLNMAGLFDYYFSYGNTLGHLGLTPEMDRAMTAALTLAADELGDMERCEQVWKWILRWGREHQQWDYLLEQCKLAHQFGINNESYLLQQLAGEAAFYAMRGLDRREEAKQGIQKR
ncbi:MAG: hypothetical protein NW224_20110 [Leptolyngbyaceae cyanobacterium bins.302]|nr:hypothetical protein [Leptolyngbyaceae cyanobacterium bins.302]